MHHANRLFWDRSSKKYPRYFAPPANVIECGSYDVNGSIRDYFTATDYVGVDWRPGPKVDLVSLTHELPYPAAWFDTVASASMLEHDPYWEKSLTKMVELMKPDGILIVTWGAMWNCPHEFHTAPDGLFHALAAGKVIAFLRSLGIHIQEFQYEKTILGYANSAVDTGKGEVVLVGFKDASLATEPPLIDPLLPEDAA